MKKFHLSFKFIFNVIVVCLCIGIISYFLFSDGGLFDLVNSDLHVLWYWIVVAVFSQLLYMFIETLVIYLFIKEDYESFRFIDALKVSFTGLFWSAVTPSSTGGQPMQIYLLHSMDVKVGYATSRLMQKFLVYQVVLTLISIFSVMFNFRYIIGSENLAIILVFIIFGFVSQLTVTLVILMFSFSPNLSRKVIMFFAKLLGKIRIIKNIDDRVKSIDNQLETFHKSNKDIYKEPKLLISAIVLTFFQFVAMFAVPYFIYLSFGFDSAGPVRVITSQAFVNLMSGMIPIPGATGAAELGFTAFFGTLFLHNTLKSGTLIWRIINYYGVIFLTAPFAYLTKGKDQPSDSEAQEESSD